MLTEMYNKLSFYPHSFNFTVQDRLDMMSDKLGNESINSEKTPLEAQDSTDFGAKSKSKFISLKSNL